MIRLIMPAVEEEIDVVELCLDDHRPGGSRLMLNMVTSLDGATADGGATAPLSDADDRSLFVALRAAADVVMVGAGTVRAEDYGPVRLPDAAREARLRRGLPDVPRLAVVSRSLDLEDSSRIFEDPTRRPYVLTGRAAPEARSRRLEPHAEVVVLGEGGAEPEAMLRFLAEQGHEVVLCEGGPRLNGELVASDLVDEVNLSLSPQMVGGSSHRLAHGAPPVTHGFRLERMMQGDRMLFARYLRDRR